MTVLRAALDEMTPALRRIDNRGRGLGRGLGL